MNEDTDRTDHLFPSINTLQRLAISESGFVFDPVSGHNFTVNETGMALLRLLQKNTEIQFICNSLMAKYDVSQLELKKDILEFAMILRDFVGD